MNFIIREMNYNDLTASSELSKKIRIFLWKKYDHTVYPREYLDEELKLYEPNILRKFIKDEDKYAFVAENNGKIIGVAVGKITEGVSDLSWIAVDPQWQGKGIGKKLLEMITNHSREKNAHKIIAYTFPSLTPTIAFYLRTGFIPECYLRKHWKKLDFIIMSKFI